MSHLYTDHPVDAPLPTPGAGREYTFGQIIGAAFVQLWRHKVGALLIGLAIAFVTGVVSSGAGLFLTVFFKAADMSHVGDRAATVVLRAVQLGITAVIAIATVPLAECYKWAAIRSFDRRRMSVGDLAAPLRSRWLGTSLLLMAFLIAVRVCRIFPYYLFTGPDPSTLWLVSSQVAFYGLLYAVHVLTFLAMPAALIQPQPKFSAALRDNWRILRSQALRVLVIAALGVGLSALVERLSSIVLYGLLLSPNLPGPPNMFVIALIRMCQQFIGLVPLAVSTYLTAALFRSAYGLPLSSEPPEPQPPAYGDPGAPPPWGGQP